MRLVASAVTILLLLGLLTWLLVRGTDTHAPQYEQTLQAFDDFALGEASLLRDVLQARAGLLRDYDPLTRDIDAMEGAVARMRTHAQAEGLDAGPVDRLAASVARQDELTERFKSSNAVLQNSLSYVGLLSASPPFAAQDARLASAGDAVAAAILLVARDASPDALQALRERIDAFAAQVPAVGPDAEAAEALLAHARLLLALLPAIDETLRALVAAPSRRPLEQVRALFAAHQAAVESTAHNYRVLLYVTSLALLIMLARLGMQLRTRALAQSRRAAFERVIAENSTRLINCPPAETEARIVHVLGAYGRAMNVDRAYVVLDEKPVRVFVWSADHAPYPSGWPQAALTLPAQLSEVRLNIVVLPDVAALPPSDAKATLAAVGARSWACVSLSLPGGVRGIMGFDKFETAWRVVFPLPVVRLAGDVVANAIEREYLERDRARLATRLERSHRMQVIGSLASGIAHNFNNIIAAILGYSEMIEPGRQAGGACRGDSPRRGAWARSGRQHSHLRAATRHAGPARSGARSVDGSYSAAARLAARERRADRRGCCGDDRRIRRAGPVAAGHPQSLHQRRPGDGWRWTASHQRDRERPDHRDRVEPWRAVARPLRVPRDRRHRSRVRRHDRATSV